MSNLFNKEIKQLVPYEKTDVMLKTGNHVTWMKTAGKFFFQYMIILVFFPFARPMFVKMNTQRLQCCYHWQKE